jgi:hypothetical protein
VRDIIEVHAWVEGKNTDLTEGYLIHEEEIGREAIAIRGEQRNGRRKIVIQQTDK